jgi:twitching motility protein PilJ
MVITDRKPHMRTTSFCTALLLLVLVANAPSARAASDACNATRQIARVQVLSQQLAGVARDAADGNVDAFVSLTQTRDGIDERLSRLKKGELPAGAGASIAGVDIAWAQLSADAGKVLDGKQVIMSSAAMADDINAKLPILNSRMDEAVKILVDHSGSATQVMIAQRQMLLADRMQRRIASIIRGGEESASAAMGLQRDAEFYRVVLAGLINGNADLNIKAMKDANAREILKDIDGQWAGLAPSITKLLDAAPNLQETREAADKAAIDAQTVLLKAEALMSRVNE